MAEPFALLAARGFNESGRSKVRATHPRSWSRQPVKEINRFIKIKELLLYFSLLYNNPT
jgi:hypothetical protein